MPRPSDTPFDWASDGTHADPGEAWDGQPSVVVPSAGKVAAGMLPNEVLPAEYFNEIVRRAMAWDAFLQEQTAPREIIIPGSAFQIPDGSDLIREDCSIYAAGLGITGLEGGCITLPDGLSGTPQRAYLDLAPYLGMAGPFGITSARITGRATDAVELDLRLVRRDPLSAPVEDDSLVLHVSAAAAPAQAFNEVVSPVFVQPLEHGVTLELIAIFDANSITGRLSLFDVTLVLAHV